MMRLIGRESMLAGRVQIALRYFSRKALESINFAYYSHP
jgi:hypothetical protein